VASSTEALDRFSMWKNRRTLLKVTFTEKGELPEKFLGSVMLVEYESLRVSLMNHDERFPRVAEFSDCTFEVGAKVLLAIRDDGEIFRCEDTGKRWEDKLDLDK
jgi:hypothetical protein